jgi:hypothetical protein
MKVRLHVETWIEIDILKDDRQKILQMLKSGAIDSIHDFWDLGYKGEYDIESTFQYESPNLFRTETIYAQDENYNTI